MTDLELSWRTANRALTALKQFFGRWVVPVWAPAMGSSVPDPAAEVRLVRRGAQRMPRQLTHGEVDLLVRAARQQQDRQAEVIIRMLSTSGLRAEELCSLSRRSYHAGSTWDQPSLTVRGKGDKVRVVPIPRDTARLLEMHLTSIPQDQRHLWTNQYQDPLTYDNLYALLGKYSELAEPIRNRVRAVTG